MRYIVLFRGINVSGKNILPMAKIRELMSNLPFHDIKTYIQSGNLAFDSEVEKEEIEGLTLQSIKDEFGYELKLFIRSQSQLQEIVNQKPFSDLDLSNKNYRCNIVFLDQSLPFDLPHLVEKEQLELTSVTLTDIACISKPAGKKVFYPNEFFDKKLNIASTSRNWRTIQKLASL